MLGPNRKRARGAAAGRKRTTNATQEAPAPPRGAQGKLPGAPKRRRKHDHPGAVPDPGRSRQGATSRLPLTEATVAMRDIWDNGLEGGENLWRYLTAERCAFLLENARLYFAAATQFTDPFEGAVAVQPYDFPR